MIERHMYTVEDTVYGVIAAHIVDFKTTFDYVRITELYGATLSVPKESVQTLTKGDKVMVWFSQITKRVLGLSLPSNADFLWLEDGFTPTRMWLAMRKYKGPIINIILLGD